MTTQNATHGFSNSALTNMHADAVINMHRHPDPLDRSLASIGEAGYGNLPSDEFMAQRGVDRVELAQNLTAGMDALAFSNNLVNAMPTVDGTPGLTEQMLTDYLQFATVYEAPEERALARFSDI